MDKQQQRFPDHLLNGYHNFMNGRFSEQQKRYKALAETGQKPRTMVVACCDSRAAPETIFDSGPGELFVVRNVANLMPPYEPDGHYHSTSAALEFAVQSLRVSDIVVMGHGRCGGIKAALDPDAEPLSPGDFIGRWMNLLKPAAEQIQSNDVMTQGSGSAPWSGFRSATPCQPAYLPLRPDSGSQGQAASAWRLVRHLDRRALGHGSHDRRLRARACSQQKPGS